MNDVEKLYDRIWEDKNAFNRLRKESLAKVVKWKFWETPDWYWDPGFHLEYRQKPELGTKKEATDHYGYDSQGRVVFIRRAVLPDDPDEDCSFFFLRHENDTFSGYEFFANRLSCTFLGRIVGGRIIRVERYGHGSVAEVFDWKTIEWKDGKVFKVRMGRGGGGIQVIETIYKSNGKVLSQIDCSKVKRKPLPKGVTMNSLTKEIRKRLTDVVVQAVTRAKVKEPAYCLALNYDCEGNSLLLPEIGIGLESDRRALLKRGGRDAKLAIWDVANFPMFANERLTLMDRDKKLDRACDLYNRELEYKGLDEPARKLILQVAADLAKMNWKGKLNTTDDFIIFAVDTDGADLKKNLKFSVSPKQMAKLKKAKLI